jgi:hypothetical protein
MGFLRELQTITAAATRNVGSDRMHDTFAVDRKLTLRGKRGNSQLRSRSAADR